MKKSKLYLGIGTLVCMLLVVAWLPSLTQPALALPPRPEPTLTPSPTPPTQPRPQVVGGFIELKVSFGATWSSANLEWQDLWTVVQWQDTIGDWHDVEGWQGTLDAVKDKMGTKRWWVAPPELGKGPLRWIIYQSQDGPLLTTSDPFHLPAAENETVSLEVTLEQ